METAIVCALGALIVGLIISSNKHVNKGSTYAPVSKKKPQNPFAKRDPEEEDPERWDGQA